MFYFHSSTDYVTTDLMENISYIQMNSYWNELFVSGVVPIVALAYMNVRIYRKINASSRYVTNKVII